MPKIATTTQRPILILYVLCIRQEVYTTINTPKKGPCYTYSHRSSHSFP
jgi:hypothetical protein